MLGGVCGLSLGPEGRVLAIGDAWKTVQHSSWPECISSSFCRCRYALDVSADRAEDVLTHKRLLAIAEYPENRPAFHVRPVHVRESPDAPRPHSHTVTHCASIFGTGSCPPCQRARRMTLDGVACGSLCTPARARRGSKESMGRPWSPPGVQRRG